MNTKEAIEFLEVEIKCLEKEIEICNPNDDIDIQVIEANKNIVIKYKQIITLLQQGEKYRLEDEARRNYANHLLLEDELLENEILEDIKTNGIDNYIPETNNANPDDNIII